MKASLHLQTRLRGNKTVLGPPYFSAPFKLAEIPEPGLPHCRAMVMNASPGVLDGDVYDIWVRMDAGTSLLLETQAFQRVFTMQGTARQEMVIQMAEGCSFSYIPHPTVPHRDAHFTSTNQLFLEAGCRLVWGEVLTPGRKLKEELFSFRHFQSRTEVFKQGKLVVKDNLVMRPSLVDTAALGNLEGFSHQASMLFLADDGWDEAYSEAFRGILKKFPGAEWGISRLPVPGLVVRIIGNKAEMLHACLKALGQAITDLQPAVAV